MDDFDLAMAAKSDQINNVDLTGDNSTMILTVKGVRVNLREDQKITVECVETQKFYRPCLGMYRLLRNFWGHPKTWPGKKMQIYRDPDVRFGKDTTGGIRISGLSHISGQKSMAVPISKGKVRQYVVSEIAADADPAPPARDEAAEDAALAAADQGMGAFGAWWNSDYGKASRASVAVVMDECKRRVAVWEAANAPPPEEDQPPM